MNSTLADNLKLVNALLDEQKDATYKFALIRGSIEVFQRYDHFKTDEGEWVKFPLGLLIERWIFYYYPIFESNFFIPQIGQDKEDLADESNKLKFRQSFDNIIRYYRLKGNGYSHFYNEYQKGQIRPDMKIHQYFIEMCVQIRDTIVQNPMKFLGNSTYQKENSIFHAKKKRPKSNVNCCIDPSFLKEYFGDFWIKREYYDALKNVGPFLIGDNSLLFKWAQFSQRRITDDKIKFGDILEKVSEEPITKRDIKASLSFYNDLKGRNIPLKSVWSGQKIRFSEEENMDHMIPFSVWRNNDLWNILPATPKENSRKSDKIPDPEFLIERKTCILKYWNYMIESKRKDLFIRQIRFSLIGESYDPDHWQDQAFDNLVEKCRYMIEEQKYPPWNKYEMPVL